MGVIWWQGTRHKEFLAAPDETTLIRIRQETSDELKTTVSIAPEQPVRAIKVKPKKLVLPDAEPAPQAMLKPEDFGDLTVSPGLDCYRGLAARGAGVMTDLATQLELRGEIQRALLAWERVIDSTDADTAQQEVARKAIQRLRKETPIWNVDPTNGATALLHVGCDRERGKALESIWEQIIAILNRASSGLIDIQLKLQISPKAASGAPPQPVTLWFSSTKNDSFISKTISIPLTNASADEQTRQLLAAVYKLLRESLNGRQDLRPLADPQGHDPAVLLESAVTRRAWEAWAQFFMPKKP